MSQLKNNTYQLEDEASWLKELHEKGAVVVKNVLSKEEVEKALNLFWEWLEILGSGIKRDDPSTWVDENWPGCGSIGFFASYGGCHTQASWFIRTRPKVKSVFGKIWNTDSLITSFDTFICWRPWWNKFAQKSWSPFVENMHVDQNPVHKPGFHCVQGMVPLIDVKFDGVGGLQIVPSTNNDRVQEELTSRYQFVSFSKSDWVELHGNDPYIGKGQLLLCNAGDMILFDSRTIHSGKICKPSQSYMLQHENSLVRLAMTVTMVPKQFQNQEIRNKRRDAFQKHIGLTHWPQEFNKNGFGTMTKNINSSKIQYKWPDLTPEIEDLI